MALLHKLRSFSLSDTLKHTSIYFIATLLIQGLGIISLPVFTYFMDTEQYGVANVYLSYATVAAVLFSFNLHWAIARYYYESPHDFKPFISVLLVCVTLLYALLGFVWYVFADPVAALIHLPADSIGWMILFVYTLILWGVFQQASIAQQHSKRVAITQVILHYLKFGVAVLCFIYLPVNPFLGKVVGEWLAASIVSLYILWILRRYWSWRGWSWRHLRFAFHYSLPLIPYALGGYILNSFDQWYINAHFHHGEVGLYSFAYKLGMLLLGLVTALLSATEPDYYKQMAAGNTVAVRRQVLTMTRLMLLGAVFLTLFSMDMGALLSANPHFRASLHLVPPIVGGYVFYGIAMFHSRGINYLKKNSYLTALVLLACGLNIVLNMYFIPIYGYGAAAHTTMASYIVMAIAAVVVTSYWLRLSPLPLAKIALYLFLAAAVVTIYYLARLDQYVLDIRMIGIKIVLFAIAAFGLYFPKK